MELIAYEIIKKLLLHEWINEYRDIIVAKNIIHFRMNTYNQIDCSHEIRKWLLLGRWTTTDLDSVLKSKDMTLLTKMHIIKAMYGLSSSHVWMWELDHKEGWAPKNSCFWTMVLEKTLESPLDSKEIKPVNPKGNQPWIFIVRTDAEAEAEIIWPPDVKRQLIGKDPDARKDWRQKKGVTEYGNHPMASLIQWTWTWTKSGKWWRTGTGMLQPMGSQLGNWTTTTTTTTTTTMPIFVQWV